MSNSIIVADLLEARELLSKPGAWTVNTLYDFNYDGSQEARCINGALIRAINGRNDYSIVQERFIKATDALQRTLEIRGLTEEKMLAWDFAHNPTGRRLGDDWAKTAGGEQLIAASWCAHFNNHQRSVEPVLELIDDTVARLGGDRTQSSWPLVVWQPPKLLVKVAA